MFKCWWRREQQLCRQRAAFLNCEQISEGILYKFVNAHECIQIGMPKTIPSRNSLSFFKESGQDSKPPSVCVFFSEAAAPTGMKHHQRERRAAGEPYWAYSGEFPFLSIFHESFLFWTGSVMPIACFSFCCSVSLSLSVQVHLGFFILFLFLKKQFPVFRSN